MSFRSKKTVVFTEIGSYFFYYFPLLILNPFYRVSTIYLSVESKKSCHQLLALSLKNKLNFLWKRIRHRKFSELLCYMYFFIRAKRFLIYDKTTFQPVEVDYLCSLGFLRLIPTAQIRAATFSTNMHWSLLPKYAGMHPVYWTIRNGEKKFGFTLHEVNAKFDQGDILIQQSFEMQDHMTCDDVNGVLKKYSRKSFGKFLWNRQKFQSRSRGQEVPDDAMKMKKPLPEELVLQEDDSMEEMVLKFRADIFGTKVVYQGKLIRVYGVGNYKPFTHLDQRSFMFNGLEIFVSSDVF